MKKVYVITLLNVAEDEEVHVVGVFSNKKQAEALMNDLEEYDTDFGYLMSSMMLNKEYVTLVNNDHEFWMEWVGEDEDDRQFDLELRDMRLP